MPEDSCESSQALAQSALQKSATALAVFLFVPDVAVTVVSKINKHMAPIEGFNSIQAIPKECVITFRVANPQSLPAGATLKWTVRNHGPELLPKMILATWPATISKLRGARRIMAIAQWTWQCLSGASQSAGDESSLRYAARQSRRGAKRAESSLFVE